MSTLLNETRRSFNVRGKQTPGPFYDLIADVATEELGHIGAVAATLNGPPTGAADRRVATDTTPENLPGMGNTHHFPTDGPTARVGHALGQPW